MKEIFSVNLPFPVWSLVGPVRPDDVLPLCKVQLNTSVLSWVQPQIEFWSNVQSTAEGATMEGLFKLQ